MNERPSDNDCGPVEGKMDIHWKRGITCFFDIDGITIEVWGSSWNGREEVRVDGELVSSKRVLRWQSSHRFQHAGVDYEVRIICESLTRGTFTILLLRNGVEVDSDQASSLGTDLTDEDGNLIWGKAVKRIGPVFLLSGVAGMVVGYTLAKLLL